jgi:hypothetical protein
LCYHGVGCLPADSPQPRCRMMSHEPQAREGRVPCRQPWCARALSLDVLTWLCIAVAALTMPAPLSAGAAARRSVATMPFTGVRFGSALPACLWRPGSPRFAAPPCQAARPWPTADAGLPDSSRPPASTLTMTPRCRTTSGPTGGRCATPGAWGSCVRPATTGARAGNSSRGSSDRCAAPRRGYTPRGSLAPSPTGTAPMVGACVAEIKTFKRIKYTRNHGRN